MSKRSWVLVLIPIAFGLSSCNKMDAPNSHAPQTVSTNSAMPADVLPHGSASGSKAPQFDSSTPAAQSTPRRARIPGITWLDTGLNTEDQETWHHLSEGSELVPLTVLEALKSPRTGESFLSSLAEYGFLLESSDPHDLAIGWSRELRDIGGHQVEFVGINCAACHTGELRYRNQTLRLDGAPNLFALEQFFLDLRTAVQSLRENRMAAFLFARDLIRLHHDPNTTGEFMEVSKTALALLHSVEESGAFRPLKQALAESVGALFQKAMGDEGTAQVGIASLFTELSIESESNDLLGELSATLTKDGSYLRRRFRTLEILSAAIDSGVDLGPGRGDSFGIIRNLLWPDDPIRLDAPVSTPHLFDFGGYKWIHWDGNTQSVMQRNIAQAIALGADYDPATRVSTALPFNLHRLETVGRKLKSPKWPEALLGTIDVTRVARGQEIFRQQRCAECHSGETAFPLDQVKTSPIRANNFALPLAGRAFSEVLAEFGAAAEAGLFQQHQVSPEQARQFEPGKPEWRTTHGYVARRLAGVWATAPYLHNGSVPTIYDLLQPAAKRPPKFPVGHRDFDPQKLGFLTAVDNPTWEFDATIPGNSNQGHEFGVDLPESSKYDLIEFLKTL